MKPSSSKGQSLVEILIGIAIGTVFIIIAATLIAPSFQFERQTVSFQVKTALGNEMVDNVRSWATGNWSSVLALATGTANTYYLNTSSSPFIAVASSSELIVVGTKTFMRYFYLSDVYRDSSGNVTSTTSGNSYDPSTKLVSVVVNAFGTNPGTTSTLLIYLTRNQSDDFSQASWSGGSGQNNPVTIASTSFYADSNITISATGSIQLFSNGNSCVL